MKALKILSKKPAATGAPSAQGGSPFDALWKSPFPFAPWASQWLQWPAMPALKTPVVDVSEDDKEVTVKAELPGLTDNDLDLSYANGMLHLKGEKKAENEEKKKNIWHKESWHGLFTRDIPVGDNVDWKKAAAQYKDGVLTVALPKIPGKENRVKIQIQ